jgi:CYTH domain-containing protein
LRLRQQSEGGNYTVFKLTQKLRQPVIGARQGLITSMDLTKDEFAVLAKLPAKILVKIRYSMPPFGIDLFEDALSGLVVAEAEFDSAEEAAQLPPPSFLIQEVSGDPRFTGGRLVATSRQELQSWLHEYGIDLDPL